MLFTWLGQHKSYGRLNLTLLPSGIGTNSPSNPMAAALPNLSPLLHRWCIGRLDFGCDHVQQTNSAG
jgi:hypothetical protein